MWSFFKAMPVLPKLLVIVLVLGSAYKISTLGRRTHHIDPQPSEVSTTYSSTEGGDDEDSQTSSQSSSQSNSQTRSQANPPENSGNSASAAQQRLTQYQAQQKQLMAVVYQCEAQMNQAANGMARAAMNGQMAPGAPCQQQMPAWTAQEAFLETQIYRIQSGDYSTPLNQVTGIPIGQQSSSGSRTGASSWNNPDRGTDAVENWDRQVVRGNSNYDDESGQRHELATQAYYFRDRSSGQIISSSSPNPPNNGRDYEQFTYAQPQ